MARPPMGLLALLGGGGGVLSGYLQEKEQQRKEQEAKDLLAQSGRDRAALQTTEFSQLPPALQGELYGFLTRKPEEQVQGNAELARMLAGPAAPYSPGIQSQARAFASSPSAMTIPAAFAGNPLMHEAAVAHLAGQQSRRATGSRSGTSPAAGVLTKAEAETARDLLPELTSIDKIAPGPLHDRAIENWNTKKTQRLTSNFMKHFSVQYGRAPTLNETQVILGDRFDEPTFQNQASTMLRSSGGALPPGASPGNFPTTSGVSFTDLK